MSLAVIRAERLAKLERLRHDGIDPHGSRSDAEPIHDVRARCPENHGDPDAAPESVTVAGRVMAIRDMGRSCWIDLRDQSGKIQVNLLQKRIPDQFEHAKLLDVGDIVEATGDLQRSRVGEITVFATAFRYLTKSIEPLPAKWSGLKDVEIRFRRRYLDLIANDESRERFILRSRLIAGVRRWLDDRRFLEVETPMLQAIYGGAAARPFVTHHNALDMDLFLRISPETYLKRLLVGGLERVYELNRNFRNEGIDTSHNPEFTMIEIYQAYADFTDMMTLTETLVSDLARQLLGDTRIRFGDHDIDVAAPWPRRSIHDLIRDVGGVSPDDDHAMLDRLLAARALGAEKAAAVRADLAAGGEKASLAHDQLLKECMDELVEPRLIQPTFVTHHPASLNPLCKRNKDNPSLSDRFEVIVAGFELANAFSELNDPIEQRARFEAQTATSEDDEEAYCNVVDDDYVSALEVGLPPAGGLGIGIDRLVMLLTGQPSIREVVLFPTLKPKTQAEVMADMDASLDADEAPAAE